MQLSEDWHKRTNKRLFDILSDIIKESNAPKVPDHGYTIAERAPEVVTAPGVYFPSEKGRVIPLESRQSGGVVQKVRPKNLFEKMEEAAGIEGSAPVPVPEPAPVTPAPKGFTAPPYTGPRPWRKDIPTGSRQSVGMVTPKPTGVLQGMLQKLASYTPFPIPGITTQKEERLIPLADIMVDKKKTPLLPRQSGGEVDPNLFKETFSVNYGDPTQNGIKTEANTALVESTPINVSPVSTPSSQPYVSQDGANLASTITPSTSLTGMAEYEANARKIRGLPLETETQTINQTGGQPNQIPGSLGAYAPPAFKENTRSPIFRSDQLVAYNKKYGIDQESDLYERLKASSGLSSMKPTTTGAPVVSPTKTVRPTGTPMPPPPPPNPADKWIEEAERKRQRAFRNSAYTLFPDTMPLLSRQGGGPTSPDPDEGLTEEERKRRLALLKAEFPEESLAASHAPAIRPPTVGDTVPKEEPTETPKVETQADLSEFRKEVLPSGETRYTLPGTEGTATVGPERFFVGEKEVPKGTPGAVSGDELARQGVLERATPPKLKLPERGYYEAHPEERLRDQLREENKPLLDAYNKLIEENTRRAQGFGLPMDTRAARVVQAEATKAGPELAQGLGQAMALNLGVPGAGKAGTPHWVQNEKGEWVGLTSRGISPTGVIGIPQTGKSPTEVGLIVKSREVGSDGKPTPAAIEAKGVLDDIQKRKTDVATTGLREFEMATGTDPIGRGTPEYSKSYMEFLTGKKQATQITDPIQQKKLGTSLRKEFNALQPVKDYRDIETRFNVMSKAVEESKTTKNFVAVDQALITIFNKMTDPQSVVRESEYIRTPQDLALWNRIKGKVSKMVAGGAGLTPDDRNALFSMAKQFQATYESKYNQLKNEYRGYAVDYGLDPDMVIKQSRAADFAGNPPGGGEERQIIGGKSYIRRDGKWYEE